MIVLGLIDIPWWILAIISIALYILYTTKDYDYFKKQGVPSLKPLPIFGTFFTFYKKGMVKYDLYVQEQFKGNKVVGDFPFGSTRGTVFDADFLSKILVKDFPTFTNRLIVRTGHPLNDNHLITLSDHRWRYVRHEMTPAFSSGKLIKMNSEINGCAKTLERSLAKAVEKGGKIVIKNYTGGFTMDVIARTAFGIRVDSQEDPNNPFVKHAHAIFTVPTYKFFLPAFFPGITKLLKSFGFYYDFFGKDATNFFREVTRQAMTIRQDKELSSHVDFLQLMINAQRGDDIRDKDEESEEQRHPEGGAGKGLSDDEILSNAMLFFAAGYETTATSLQFFLYNMARFPEIQEKLVEEIKEVIGEEENIEYTKLSELPYLEQCINENLRIYPPAVCVNRVACRDVTINNIHIRKGMVLNVPIYAIHHDPQKWPEPELFDPERFSAENKKNRHPFHFLPFGHGPRNCIGMRMALFEMKVAIIYMFRSFKFTTCDKTVQELTFKNNLILMPVEDIVLRVEHRQD